MTCTFLQHNLCMCHHSAQLSPRCRCSSSKLGYPQVSWCLTDRWHMSNLHRPLLLSNTSLPRSSCTELLLSMPNKSLLHSCCTRHLLSMPCTFLWDTQYTALHPAQLSLHCTCILSSPQASRCLPDRRHMWTLLLQSYLQNIFLHHNQCRRFRLQRLGIFQLDNQCTSFAPQHPRTYRRRRSCRSRADGNRTNWCHHMNHPATFLHPVSAHTFRLFSYLLHLQSLYTFALCM